jgi:TonB-like protein
MIRYSIGMAAETFYDNIVIFQGRYVSREVTLKLSGKVYLKIRVEVLESLAQLNEADFTPPADAIAVADSIELRSSSELWDYILKEPSTDRLRGRGTALVEIVLGKDGHVKSVRGIDGPAELQQSAMAAARTIEIRPFLVLGEPVEVKTTWEFSVH